VARTSTTVSAAARRRVALEIINHEAKDKDSISKGTSLSGALVELVLQKFADQRLVKLVRTMGGVYLLDFSPELKRAFGEE
jgi:hypothetical protein